MNKKIALTLLLAAALAATAATAADAVTNKNSRTGPFILGAEVSWAQEDEADGAEYFDHGVKRDIFDILAARKINFIRLRLFVNPGATNGYAARKSEAFCDLAHVKVLATRAKAHGMGLLLDIHYGDTWTSPGHQDKPGAWRELSFAELTNKVHEYTRDAVAALRDNGTQPDMVQVGNEISDGLLFPDGSRSKPENFAALVGAGCRAVREVDPKIKIVLHHHLGRDNARMRSWIDNFLKHGVDFDLLGMSCYAQAQEGDWQRNFDDLATRYPNHGQLVVEYSGRKRFINELMFNTPDAKGWGTFIWEATRHREALFDHEGVNAGGGQHANFKSQETNAPAATNIVVNIAPKVEPEKNGGRYDVNALADLYPQMAKDFVGIAPPHKILPPLAPALTNVAPYILTPPAPAAPRINGAKVVPQWNYYRDICYFLEGKTASRLTGFAGDACGEREFLTRMTVRDGKLFVQDGTVVAGPKLIESHGLKNFFDCVAEIKKIGEEVWGDCDGRSAKEHRFGKGNVIWGKSLLPSELFQLCETGKHSYQQAMSWLALQL